MSAITKERIELFIKNPLDNGLTRGEQMEVARIALASLETKPIGAFHIAEQQVDGTSDYIKDGEWPIDNGTIEVYAAPPVPVIQADVAQAIENLKQKLVECNRYNYCADAVKGVEDACRAVSYSQADNQPASGNQAAESNRGNEWTGNPDIDNAIIMLDRIDTLENCDDDRIEAVKAVLRRLAGNSPVTPDSLSTVCAEAYQVVGVMADALGVFGDAAVQKVLDNLSQQKLVHRDVLPFSLPVTPDGWISCSERMPEKNQNVLISVNFDSSLVEPLICSARYTGSTFRRGDATIKPGNGIEQATHWMPLPEPPQEVNQ
ncbi:DUF551 domain-containing protein [Escherichia coli]|nr:DUF551 domain-containing protein [Escherichia coli]